MVGKLTLGDGVTVATHSLVNKSASNNCLIAGAPAEMKRDDYHLWTERDGERYMKRVQAVEVLKLKIYGS